MSKFGEILKSAKEGQGKAKQSSGLQPKVKTETKREVKKQGRPKGKRSDPNYEQVTAYIKKETHQQTKIALLQQKDIQDFSELVEELLIEWLRTQNVKSLK